MGGGGKTRREPHPGSLPRRRPLKSRRADEKHQIIPSGNVPDSEAVGNLPRIVFLHPKAVKITALAVFPGPAGGVTGDNGMGDVAQAFNGSAHLVAAVVTPKRHIVVRCFLPDALIGVGRDVPVLTLASVSMVLFIVGAPFPS